MNKVAFKIFDIDIMWYGVIITSAMMLAVYCIMKESKNHNFKEDDFLDISIISIPCAIICARIYYVLFNLDMYTSIKQMLDIRQGGLAIHGGIIGGFIAVILVTKYKRMNFLKSTDVVVPFLALGQSIGRWGNYINQEAYGSETNLPWAININGKMVHPTFLYESIWNIVLFLILYRILQKKKFDGQVTALYLIIYSLGRFFIEILRTDSLMFFGLKTAQIMSIILMLFGFIMLIALNKKGINKSYIGNGNGI